LAILETPDLFNSRAAILASCHVRLISLNASYIKSEITWSIFPNCVIFQVLLRAMAGSARAVGRAFYVASGFFNWITICVASRDDAALAKTLAFEISSFLPQ
jgi:hypothetical protein